MTVAERQRLWSHWRAEMLEQKSCEFDEMHAKLTAARNHFNEVKRKRDVNVMCATSIIGCTANGMANFLPVLQAVAPKILIVEEAAEMVRCAIALASWRLIACTAA